jgi:hypothetical protein
MKVQEVILRALSRKITWWQAAEIIGISDRQMRRWRQRYEEFGYVGLFDRRCGKPSTRRVPLGSGGTGAGPVLGPLFRSERAAVTRSGVGETRAQAGPAPQTAERRPLPGMLLHSYLGGRP